MAVTVADYCLCEAPHNQFQVKLKLKLVNTGQGSVHVGVANIRAMVRGGMPGGDGAWYGKLADGSPSAVNIEGSTYTAIPANRNHAYEMVDARDATWATLWYGETLGPTDTYFEGGRNRGDVVFYIPYSPGQLPKVDGVGVVSDDAQGVLGWAPFSSWPSAPVPPGTF
ncbi:hypothetical protein SKC41_26410 [Mycobacterium sp. 050128]|uniref:hypothetical protein n=1 Tax=Mycobacterium sp. 050128 TaxID=3096112 RepID=UPI002ED80AED